jgi:hypothetical protein
MLSCGVNVIVSRKNLSSGANGILWCKFYHVGKNFIIGANVISGSLCCLVKPNVIM